MNAVVLEAVEQVLPLIETVVIFAAFAVITRLARTLVGGRPSQRPSRPDRRGPDDGSVHLGWLLSALALATAALGAAASHVLADLGLAIGLAAGAMVGGRLCAHRLHSARRLRSAPVAPQGRRWAR